MFMMYPKKLQRSKPIGESRLSLRSQETLLSLCHSKLRLKQLLHLDDFGESWIGDRGTGYTEKVVSN